MRKITYKAIVAFEQNRPFTSGNTAVKVDDKCGVPETGLYLHGHKIAYKLNGTLFIDACGWLTNTTKERLNGIDGVSINQKDYQWFLNGRQWGGSLVAVDGFGI